MAGASVGTVGRSTTVFKPNKKGSFLFEPFYPEVSQELNRRKSSDNLARTYMPFVRVTTAAVIPNKGAFFSVGLHGLNTGGPYAGYLHPNIENIYEPVGGGNLLGYTYSNDGRIVPVYTEEVPVLTQTGPNNSIDFKNLIAGKAITDNERIIQANVRKFPPPGITKVNVRRAGIAGALLQAEVEMYVHTIGQLQALQEFLIIPSMHVVVEWGQIASGDDPAILKNSIIDFASQRDITFLQKLSSNRLNRRHIFQEYTSKSNCNYDFMVGVVSNFTFKQEGNSYVVTLKISSPGDIIAGLSTTETSLQENEGGTEGSVFSSDLKDYFNYFFENKILTDHFNDQYPDFKKHIFIMQTPPKTDEDTDLNTDDVNIPTSAADVLKENTQAIFITWTYFINEILHGTIDTTNSIMGWMIGQNMIPQWYLYPQMEKLAPNTDFTSWLSSPPAREHPIGCHPWLRSIDPAIMVIYNKRRQDALDNLTESSNIYNSLKQCDKVFDVNSKAAQNAYKEFQQYGHFDDPNDDSNSGHLSQGVWLNHNVIIEAFNSTRTMYDALSYILSKMSEATGHYWNLQLHLNEASDKLNVPVPDITTVSKDKKQQPTNSDDAGSNFIVVDANFADTKDAADQLAQNPNDIYMFNRRLNSREADTTFKLSAGSGGSELLSLDADFNLPNILASAIAIQGIKGAEGEDPFGLIGINTPKLTEQGVYRTDKLIDILKPSKDAQYARGPSEAEMYNVHGSSAGKLVMIFPQGTQHEGTKVGSPLLAIASSERIKSMFDTLSSSEKVKETIFKTGGKPDVILLSMTEIDDIIRKSTDNVTIAAWNDTKNKIAVQQDAQKRYQLLSDFMNRSTDGSDSPTLGGVVGESAIADRYDKLVDSTTKSNINTLLGAEPDNATKLYFIQMASEVEQLNITNAEQAVKGGTAYPPYNLSEAVKSTVTKVDPKDNVTTSAELTDHIAQQLQFQLNNGSKTVPTNREIAKFNTTTSAEVRKAMMMRQAQVKNLQAVVERYKNYGTIIYVIEPIPSYMSKLARQHAARIGRGEITGQGSNLFAPAPTRLRVKISLPGIGAIHIGDLFWVDRIQPNFYLDGAFSVIGLVDTITPESGWITNIEGVFMYLGRFHFAQHFKNTQPAPINITNPVFE